MTHPFELKFFTVKISAKLVRLLEQPSAESEITDDLIKIEKQKYEWFNLLMMIEDQNYELNNHFQYFLNEVLQLMGQLFELY